MNNKDKWIRINRSFFWDPDQDPEIIGKLVAIRQGRFNADVYDLKTDAGIITVPSSTVLKGVIDDNLIDHKIRIKFLGWSGGKPKSGYRKFEVYKLA